MKPELVYLDQYSLRGQNFYAMNAERYGITKEELKKIGVTSARAQVDKLLIPVLQKINEELKIINLELFISDAYREPGLYKLAYEKRTAKFGKQMTDRLMNITEMPHSTGLTIDAVLFDIISNKEIPMRNKQDGPEALFLDYYKNKSDPESQSYQKNQELLSQIMIKHGFELGRLKEYFHFNYKKTA